MFAVRWLLTRQLKYEVREETGPSPGITVYPIEKSLALNFHRNSFANPPQPRIVTVPGSPGDAPRVPAPRGKKTSGCGSAW